MRGSGDRSKDLTRGGEDHGPGVTGRGLISSPRAGGADRKTLAIASHERRHKLGLDGTHPGRVLGMYT
ncbi:MAG: hypothetical protein ACREQ5_12255, partial [Candidatus Dormibacteria bacterium]